MSGPRGTGNTPTPTHTHTHWGEALELQADFLPLPSTPSAAPGTAAECDHAGGPVRPPTLHLSPSSGFLWKDLHVLVP